jgi:hypothetical protein
VASEAEDVWTLAPCDVEDTGFVGVKILLISPKNGGKEWGTHGGE